MAVVVLALVVSTIAGALLAIWKLRVLSLLPASAFFVLSAIFAGMVQGGLGTIALEAVGVIVALQLSYLATAVFADLIPSALHARPVAASLRVLPPRPPRPTTG